MQPTGSRQGRASLTSSLPRFVGEFIAIVGGRARIVLLILLVAGIVVLPQRLISPGRLQVSAAAIEFDLPPLAGLLNARSAPVPGIKTTDLGSEVVVLNVFASWCPTCREEHKTLMTFAESRMVPVIGVNYQDQAAQAVEYLTRFGNPYKAVGSDPDIVFSRRLGVIGVPTTFVIGKDGWIQKTIPGALTPERVDRELIPAVQKALRAAS